MVCGLQFPMKNVMLKVPNNKLCDESIVCCSSDPGKGCIAVKTICYGKICWRIRNTYKNQIQTKMKKILVSVLKVSFFYYGKNENYITSMMNEGTTDFPKCH